MSEPNSKFTALRALLEAEIEEEEREKRKSKFSALRALLERDEDAASGMAGKILDYLKKHPDASLRQLRKLGKSQSVDAALKELEGDFRIARETSGVGKPTKFSVIEEDSNRVP